MNLHYKESKSKIFFLGGGGGWGGWGARGSEFSLQRIQRGDGGLE